MGTDVIDPAADAPIARPGRPLIRQIQAALNEIGLDAAPADGLSGSRTVQAIRLFKVARRLEVTDDVTSRLLAELGLTQPKPVAQLGIVPCERERVFMLVRKEPGGALTDRCRRYRLRINQNRRRGAKLPRELSRPDDHARHVSLP